MTKAHQCDYRTKAEELEAKLALVQERLNALERQVEEGKKKAIGRTREGQRKPSNPPKARPKNDAAAQAAREAKRRERDSIPTETVEHRVSEEERSSCQECGNTTFVEVAADISSELEWVPGRFVRRLHRRETWCCASCKTFVRAPAPARAIEGGQYGPGLIAHTVVQKCADSMPLYRQTKALQRDGVHIARSTLVDLFRRAAENIEPIYNRMLELIPTQRVVYADETSLKMQKVEKLGFIWNFATENVITYCFSPDRSGQTPREVLKDSEGVLVVDGYTGYNTVTTPDRRRRAGCIAHARRKFVDIDDDDARQMIAHLDDVFRVEREAKEQGIIGKAEHRRLRDTRSRDAMNAVKTWCDKKADGVPPKSPLGAALRYFVNQWDPLTVFLDDIGIEPHNMISERLLRTIALGRKNYLFVGHEDAGKNHAMLCSLIATCTLHGINATRYLADLLIRVQTHPAADIDDLLPQQWKTKFGQPDVTV